MNDSAPAFAFYELRKSFGEDEFTLGPLDFELEPGRVLAFVGPNGAGKTTTMSCLAGLLRPDSGEAAVFGRRVSPSDPAWKEDVGYVGELSGFYRKLTAGENLRILERYYPRFQLARAEELARRFELPLGKKVKDLSLGNRAKLALVAALAPEPRLLLLDEPTSGLDPVVRSDVLDVLWEVLEDGGRSIFYSTHVISDISRLADEIAFISGGRLVEQSSKEELTDSWRKVTFHLAGHEWLHFPKTYEHRRDGAEHELLSYDCEGTLAQLHEVGARDIVESRLPIDEIAVAILRRRRHVAAL